MAQYLAEGSKARYKSPVVQIVKGQILQMYEERFLEQALAELQSLRDENEELKRKLSVYEEFVKQAKEMLNNWKKKDEKVGV